MSVRIRGLIGVGALVCAGLVAVATVPTDASAVTATGGSFVGVTPYRVLDTREAGPLSGCVTQASARRVPVAGVAGSGVPSGVAAVALNVTVVTPSIPGFLTVYPAGVSRPTASSLNYVGGQVVANNVAVKVGTADSVDVYASGGCPQVVVDVVGYFNAGTAEPGGFTGVTPYRLTDTRNPGPLTGCVTQASPRRVPVAGVAGSGVPSGAAAVALNVTVVAGPTVPGYVTVYPAGATRPTASTVNFVPGQVVPNGTVVKVGTSDSGLLHDLVTSDLWCRGALLEGCPPCRGPIPVSSVRT